MTIKTQELNGYTAVYGKFFNPMECSVSNSLTENLEQHRKSFSASKNTARDSKFFPLSPGSSMIDEYNSISEKNVEEAPWVPKLLPKPEYCRPVRSNNEWGPTYSSAGALGCLAASSLNTSWLGVREPIAGIAGRSEDNCDREPSMDLVDEDYLTLMVPRSINMWSPPPSPILQCSPCSIEDHFPDPQSVFSNSILHSRSVFGQQHGTELLEKTFDETTDGSFLFVKTNNVEKLQRLLRERGLELQDIGKTRIPGVLVVLFKTHEFAKRAFTTQQEIGVRMVPPKFTKKYWFKNPSPKFPVIFETTRRLTVKTGKSSTNVKIGDFLMMDAKKGRGCLILADQLKGHRMRVVGYIGKFMNTDGSIIEQRSMSKQKVVGWISTRSHQTKQKFVIRKSMNEIEDYVYDGD